MPVGALTPAAGCSVAADDVSSPVGFLFGPWRSRARTLRAEERRFSRKEKEIQIMIRMMRFAAFIAFAAALLSVPFFRSNARNVGNTVSVIVEFRDDPAAVYAARAKKNGATLSNDQIRAYRDQLTASQNQFLNALKSSGITFQLQTISVKDASGNVAGSVPLRYTLVYNGVTLTVPEIAVPTIASMSQVKKVHANGVLHPDLYKSVPYIRADQVYGKNPNDLTQFANNPDGDEGQGIYIAVIDTGIDWTHPMFGGDPTPPRLGVAPAVAAVNTNQKVVYQLPLADIITDGFGHGTHVASEAAGYLASAPGPDGIPGTADDIPLHGVAPQAKLMSYKVCSDVLSTAGEAGAPTGGCLTSNITMALEDAVSPQTVDLQPKPIANVINMSLGGAGGPDDVTSVAADNATLVGACVVAAAGNSGPGEGTVGSPGAGRHVISPAANSDPASHSNWSVEVLSPNSFSQLQTGAVTPANNFQTQAGFNRLMLYAQAGTPIPPDNSMAQYYTLVNNPTVTWPATVSGRIALVENSGPASATFFDICNQAVNAGAVAMLLDSTVTNPTAVKCSIPAANIMDADAQVLIGAMSSNGTPANGDLSQFPVRLNPDFDIPFVGSTAVFSSRGPVQGFGQVKPDISAPGVNILAAVPPASAIAALSAGANGVNYAAISGTSMATPHTSGSVALIRAAHPDWSPDVVRTALINTATNMRDVNQRPKADGLGSNSVNDQGGGLIDVYHAVNAKALMGVAGDGITEPTILGSHSFGEVPVANNRTTTTQSVNVTIQDISGQGGTYNIAVANNRDLQLGGINVTTSPSSVNVPAGGTATYTVNVNFDGNAIRDPNTTDVNGTSVTFRPIEMQWYVTAQRADGGESLRMPFYYKPAPSVPSSSLVATDTQTFTGTITAGDQDQQTLSGVTYEDFPVQCDGNTLRLTGDLDFFQVVNGTFADLDLYLLGPDGTVIASSTAPGGPEHISAPISSPGTYTWRVAGSLNAQTDFTLTSALTKSTAVAPALQQVPGDYVDANGNHVDFDGNFNLRWSPNGGEQGFEVEQSTDNQNWQVVNDLAGSATSFALSNLANGTYYFRVRALFPGQVGLYVTPPSNTVSVMVSQRTQSDITSLVKTAVSNVSLANGVFQLDLNMTNQSGNTYLPLVSLGVVGIHSTSGTVQVSNEDSGGNGTSAANAALFDYSHQLGSDEQFSPGETTGSRTLKFQDNASEMFTFDTVVTAYQGTAGSSGSGSSTTASQEQQGSSGTSVAGLPLSQFKAVMRFTVNPLTKSVTAQLVGLKL
jgi:subtilisin family serine protease